MRFSASSSGGTRRPLGSIALVRLFGLYVRRYLRRHFHGLRLSRSSSLPQLGDAPAIVYMNHPSWWDPLVGLHLALHLFADRPQAAVIDAAALGRYRILERLGFIGIERDSLRGTRRFVEASSEILSAPRGMLWLTPHGTFVDSRRRRVPFASGIGHLAGSTERGLFLPLAVEYGFWQERLPEILVRFGSPLPATELAAHRPRQIADRLALRLEQTQDALAMEARRRDPRDFVSLLRGGAGVGGVYDMWRGLRSWWRGERFEAEHLPGGELGGGR